jgi:hypothetical protein
MRAGDPATLRITHARRGLSDIIVIGFTRLQDPQGKEVHPMIRQATVWMVAAAFIVSLTGVALAQGTGTTTTPAPKAPVAKKPTMHRATGTVKSAAADSLMLMTVGKDKKEKDWTFVLDKDTKFMKAGKAIEAKDIAEKDTATVAYTEAEGKMVAKTVTIQAAKAAAAKKPQS